MSQKKSIQTSVNIRELGNGFIVEVYVYDPLPKDRCCVSAQPSIGYSPDSYIAQTFQDALNIANRIRKEKINAIEKAA